MKKLRKAVIALLGGTVLALGIVMILLPGPAILFIPGGLAILATEFLWAERALGRCKRLLAKARHSKLWLRLARRKLPSFLTRARAPQA